MAMGMSEGVEIGMADRMTVTMDLAAIEAVNINGIRRQIISASTRRRWC